MENSSSKLVELKDVSINFSEKMIISDISTSVNKGNRIGLVGDNGSGKTTILKMIVGLIEPSAGFIIKSDNRKIGYLPQNFDLDDDKTVGEIVGNSKAIYKMGLGKFQDTKVRNLSGGEKMRTGLAKVSESAPEVLMLDEPTNHLDFKARIWLERFLRNYSGALILVSHDRDLLNAEVNEIWHLDKAKIKVYSGNYSFYIKQSQLEAQKEKEEYETLILKQKLIQKSHEAEQRRAAHSGKESRSKKPKDNDRVRMGAYAETAQKTAARMQKHLVEQKRDVLEQLQAKKPVANLNFRFGIKVSEFGHKGKTLVNLKGAMAGYGDKIVVENINLLISFGDKVALFGENGSGKSAIIKEVMDSLTHVKVGYLDQNTANLDYDKTVLENTRSVAPGWDAIAIRKHLASFLFVTDFQVNQNASVLSGGERMKLSLAQIAALNPELLIMDEPTNNLDISSIEVMTSVLESFPGGVLVVSHDLYFLRSIGINCAYLVKNGSFSKLRYSPVDGEDFENELFRSL